MLRRAVRTHPVVVERSLCIHIERDGAAGPWLLRHGGSDQAAWPYLLLRDALDDAHRLLASAGGGELVVDDDGTVSATRVGARAGGSFPGAG